MGRGLSGFPFKSHIRQDLSRSSLVRVRDPAVAIRDAIQIGTGTRNHFHLYSEGCPLTWTKECERKDIDYDVKWILRGIRVDPFS